MAEALRRHPTIDDALQEISAITTSTGAPDADNFVATNGQGQLDSSLFPPGIGVATFQRTASEALSAGDAVNIWNDGGTEKVRKADRTNGRPAHVFVAAAVAQDASAECFPPGESNVALSGLTPGAPYVLGSAGAIELASSATIASGDLDQVVGTASAADTLLFQPRQPIEVA